VGGERELRVTKGYNPIFFPKNNKHKFFLKSKKFHFNL
jgi:hypothetical protein